MRIFYFLKDDEHSTTFLLVSHQITYCFNNPRNNRLDALTFYLINRSIALNYFTNLYAYEYDTGLLSCLS